MRVPESENVTPRLPQPSGLSLVTSREVSSPPGIRIAFLVFALTGVLLAVLNLTWPLARNALNYAKAALDILDRHYDLIAVVRDHDLTGGKPILFSVIAAPFVSISGAKTGVIIASALSTILFLYAVSLTLSRLTRPDGSSRQSLVFEFILTVFNPLVLYQFWSGYPDSLFAALILMAFVLIDVISKEPERDTRWHIAALGLIICAAFHTKLYGAILIPMCSLYVLLHRREFVRRAVHLRSKLAVLTATFILLSAAVVVTKLGINPILTLDTESGYGIYLSGLNAEGVREALITTVFTIVLAFNISLLFLGRSRARGAIGNAEKMFVAIYTLGLLPFPGTEYNMRYFLPLFPFFSPGIALGARISDKTVRRVVISGYAFLTLVLTCYFNIGWVEKILAPFVAEFCANHPRLTMRFDNLRLPVQIALKEQIDTVNANVPRGGTLYWSSDYYGFATHGMAHHLGVRNDVSIRYVLEPFDPTVSSESVFLVEFTSEEPPETLWQGPSWANPRPLGHGVFRLDPVSVDLKSMSGDSVHQGQPIRLRAIITAGHSISISSVNILGAATALHADASKASDFVVRTPTPGRQEFIAQAQYDSGDTATSTPVTVYVGVPALERAARSPDNLLSEYNEGSIIIPPASLSLDNAVRRVGFRFENIPLLRNATVSEAYLQFTAVESDSGRTTLTIGAELSPNSRPLKLERCSLSCRPVTKSRVTWILTPWAGGHVYRSPDLAPMIKEILAQSDWRPGSSLALFVQVAGDGRFILTYDKDGHGAPTLYIRARSAQDLE